MQWKAVAVLSCALLSGAVAQTATPNWIQEYLFVRAPQTKVVRHPIDRARYYLCWQEGTQRFGMAFRRASLEDKLRALKPGSSAPLSALLGTSTTAWSAADERVCWGRAV
jgi:hypothetical protein